MAHPKVEIAGAKVDTQRKILEVHQAEYRELERALQRKAREIVAAQHKLHHLEESAAALFDRYR